MFGKILDWLAPYWETAECRSPDANPVIYRKHPSAPGLTPPDQLRLAKTQVSPAADVILKTQRAAINQSVAAHKGRTVEALLNYGSTNTLSSEAVDILLTHITDGCSLSHNVSKGIALSCLADSLRRLTKENPKFDYFKVLIHETGRLPPPYRPEILNTLVDIISDLEEGETIAAFDLAIDAAESIAPGIRAEILCRLCDSLKYLKLAGRRPHRLLNLIQNLNPEYRRDPLEHFGAAIHFLQKDLRSGLMLQAISLSTECNSEDQSAIISSFARRCLNGLDTPHIRGRILQVMIDLEGINGARGGWSDAHQNCLWYLYRAASATEPLGESADFARVHSLFQQIPSHLQRTIFQTLFSK
ncbi:hypothetical protein [Pararhizobium arenae]|uniref:hypothetical protein n=1 Tax=Pararhizobium arenae TaxID=1856850 RepID=UPI000B076F08|nr:hypothetical protein [Pararhizobium arenae]